MSNEQNAGKKINSLSYMKFMEEIHSVREYAEVAEVVMCFKEK